MGPLTSNGDSRVDNSTFVRVSEKHGNMHPDDRSPTQQCGGDTQQLVPHEQRGIERAFTDSRHKKPTHEVVNTEKATRTAPTHTAMTDRSPTHQRRTRMALPR
ncbi:unnamed protein product [Macrosiphum euphorbiae]|uniref:Uncharacterized protein n=1 Tax=Macrosiphum euphorbiae TaxID=13131 RepID=A0AAV0XUV6_9HEMI|nr:unnamed protein product [Macrosiphum euphorbiae]